MLTSSPTNAVPRLTGTLVLVARWWAAIRRVRRFGRFDAPGSASAVCRVSLLLLVSAVLTTVSANGQQDSLPTVVRPFLEQHCLACHVGLDAAAQLSLDELSDPREANSFATWVKIFDRVRRGEMPPADAERPPTDERARMLHNLENHLHRLDADRQAQDGRGVIRRLNRHQVEHTLRDLLELPDLMVQDLLPEDSSSAGFTTVGAALDISAVHLVLYMEAARRALEEAIVHHRRPPLVQERLYFQNERRLAGRPPHYPFIALEDKALIFGRETGVFKANLTQFPAPYPGLYRIRIRARGYQTDQVLPIAIVAGQGVRRSFLTDSHLLGYGDALPDAWSDVEIVARLEYEDRIRIYPPTLRKQSFPRVNSREAKLNYGGPGLAIKWVDVEGPIMEEWPPASHRRLFGDLPLVEPPADASLSEAAAQARRKKSRQKSKPHSRPRDVGSLVIQPENAPQDAERLLRELLPLAFRRDVVQEELQRYLQLVRRWMDEGSSFEEAMRVAYTAILTSPEFLYLPQQSGELDDFALASRLSYFLINSMPDEELFRLARAGTLHRAPILRAQVERLLDDPRSQRFVQDFTGQWLDLYEIDATTPDPQLYPEFDELLRDSMLRETEMFLRTLINDDLNVKNLVDSSFAMLNGRLAEHYGIEDVDGVTLRRVELPEESPRGGLLTQAGILKVTANGTTTSPVPRGVWVLENILGTPADPPPPNVPALEPDIRGARSIREQLARHREARTCAVCHQQIDPLGFGLEHFDVIGRWRERYRSLELGEPAEPLADGRPVAYLHGPPVLAGDTLANGRTFETVQQYKSLLSDEERLAETVLRKLIVYSTGAIPGFADRRAINGIVDRTAQRGLGMRTLIHELVQSDLFRRN